jgi:outer membrane receptor for ferrienterochelin and colicin
MNIYIKIILIAFFQIFQITAFSQTGSIEGKITDKKNGEEVIGATILIDGTTVATATTFDGTYKISKVKPGIYNIRVSFISYNPVVIENIEVKQNQVSIVNCELDEASVDIDEVKVTTVRRTNTEIAMMSTIKTSNLVVSGISSQQISKSLDKDASEVIRRVPGITIYNGKFINVRGLAERYNNVWLNNGATPSTETDIRAFSFDVIPSNLIDNIMVYKSGAPELPLDFSGGFIKIFTKNMPDNNYLQVEYGTAYNSNSTFRDFSKYQGGSTDFIGFDDGTRALPTNYPSDIKGLDKLSLSEKTELARAFNSNWAPHKITAIPDQKFGLTLARKFTAGQLQIGNITSVNYGTSFETQQIVGNKYSSFDWETNIPIADYVSSANQYSQSVKLSILHNWIFLAGKTNKIEFRNLLSQNSFSRAFERTLHKPSELIDQIEQANQFMSRSIYTGQLAGDHKLNEEKSSIDWNIAYSYANRNEPDKKVITKQLDQFSNEYELRLSDIVSPTQGGRVYQYNFENIISASINFEQKFMFGNFAPSLKIGSLVEKKSREFNARNIGVINRSLETDFLNNPDLNDIFSNGNYSDTLLSIAENTNKTDSYVASNELMAGYMSLNIPITKKVNIFCGIRGENNIMKLNTYDISGDKINIDNNKIYFKPSANISYKFTQKFLARVAYFSSVNRPEFREIAPYNYYDYTERASYQGEPALKDAIVQNADLRFEYYPTDGETYSIAFFYKHFANPIELKYNGAGQSGLSYIFGNANAAESKGIEIEIRRNLDFVSVLKNYSIVFNGSLINSEVIFPKGSNSYNRPMYGQSPYIINAGIYYQKPEWGLTFNAMYNIIGERIVIVGVKNQNSIDDIPDYYEQPRNLLDISVTKKLGKRFDLKAGIKDIFHNPAKITQTFENNGLKKELVFKEINAGTIFSLGISLKL